MGASWVRWMGEWVGGWRDGQMSPQHNETKLCFDGSDGNSPGTWPGEMITPDRNERNGRCQEVFVLILACALEHAQHPCTPSFLNTLPSFPPQFWLLGLLIASISEHTPSTPHIQVCKGSLGSKTGRVFNPMTCCELAFRGPPGLPKRSGLIM